jgi:hypothetical protein
LPKEFFGSPMWGMLQLAQGIPKEFLGSPQGLRAGELHLRRFAALLVGLCLAAPGFSVAPKKATRKHTSTSASTKPGTAVKRGSSVKSRRVVRSRKSKQGWRTGQMTPTPERYKEIQQALIDKGYLQGPASGVWGPDCVQSLKKYQQDQKLEPSGKIDSLSLIALGLGPKREPMSSTGVLNRPPTNPGAR